MTREDLLAGGAPRSMPGPLDLTREFGVAVGSVIGREHVRLLRSAQDGAGAFTSPSLLAVAVTDGCSQGCASEVGAKLGAAWLVARAPGYWKAARGSAELFARAVGAGLTAYLERIARGLSPTGIVEPKVVQDFLLFGFLLAMVDPLKSAVVGLGDGAYSVNGRWVAIDPGPDNAPWYPAYGMLDRRALVSERRRSEVRVHFDGETTDVRSIVVATDGVLELRERAHEPLRDGTPQDGLEQFEHNDRFVENPTLLQRRLVALGGVNHRLHDDTTVALIRRCEVRS